MCSLQQNDRNRKRASWFKTFRFPIWQLKPIRLTKPVSKIVVGKICEKAFLSRPPFPRSWLALPRSPFAMAAFLPSGAQHSSVRIFLWVSIGAIFDYFSGQDSHEMIAFKNEADLSIKEVD